MWNWIRRLLGAEDVIVGVRRSEVQGYQPLPTVSPGEVWFRSYGPSHPWDTVRRVAEARVLDVKDGWVKFEKLGLPEIMLTKPAHCPVTMFLEDYPEKETP